MRECKYRSGKPDPSKRRCCTFILEAIRMGKVMKVSDDIKYTGKYFRAWIMSREKFIKIKDEVNNDILLDPREFNRRANSAGGCGFCIEYDPPQGIADCKPFCPASKVCLTEIWKTKRAVIESTKIVEEVKKEALAFCDWCLAELDEASPIITGEIQ